MTYTRVQWNRKRSRVTVYSESGIEGFYLGQMATALFDEGISKVIDYIKAKAEEEKNHGKELHQKGDAEQGRTAQESGRPAGSKDPESEVGGQAGGLDESQAGEEPGADLG